MTSKKAVLEFLQWQDLYSEEKPFNIFLDIPADAEDQRVTNLVFEEKEVVFTDVRGNEQTFNLESHGFFYRQFAKDFDFSGAASVEGVYLPAVISLLQQEFKSAQKVVIFDWKMRKSNAGQNEDVIDLADRMAPLRPANRAHIDTTPAQVATRVYENITDSEEHLLQSRVRVINVWRPLSSLVKDWPLAICDGTTVDWTKLVDTDVVRAAAVSSNMFMMYSSKSRWYYMSRQRPDELLIFKQFDSDQSAPVKACPHAAFRDEELGATDPPRASIEVRALVFTALDDKKDTDVHEKI